MADGGPQVMLARASRLRAVVGAAATLWFLDGLWIATVATPLFITTLGDTLIASPRWLPVLLFYAFYPLGLAILAVFPAIAFDRMASAVALGATVGAIAYGTFDLTNLALLKAYTVSLALVDWAWGTTVSSIAAGAGFAYARRAAGSGGRA